jgi:hypothetical protein
VESGELIVKSDVTDLLSTINYPLNVLPLQGVSMLGNAPAAMRRASFVPLKIGDGFSRGLVTVFFLISFIVGTRNRTKNNGEQTNTRLNINRCALSSRKVFQLRPYSLING